MILDIIIKVRHISHVEFLIFYFSVAWLSLLEEMDQLQVMLLAFLVDKIKTSKAVCPQFEIHLLTCSGAFDRIVQSSSPDWPVDQSYS